MEALDPYPINPFLVVFVLCFYVPAVPMLALFKQLHGWWRITLVSTTLLVTWLTCNIAVHVLVWIGVTYSRTQPEKLWWVYRDGGAYVFTFIFYGPVIAIWGTVFWGAVAHVLKAARAKLA